MSLPTCLVRVTLNTKPPNFTRVAAILSTIALRIHFPSIKLRFATYTSSTNSYGRWIFRHDNYVSGMMAQPSAWLVGAAENTSRTTFVLDFSADQNITFLKNQN
jgi:hypothetical protein